MKGFLKTNTNLAIKIFHHDSFTGFQGRNIAILYGSQTGTAEEFAGRLAKDAQRYGMKALVLDPEGSNDILYLCLRL